MFCSNTKVMQMRKKKQRKEMSEQRENDDEYCSTDRDETRIEILSETKNEIEKGDRRRETDSGKKKTNWKFCKWIKQYILFCQNKAACKRVYIFNSLSLFERPRALHCSLYVYIYMSEKKCV